MKEQDIRVTEIDGCRVPPDAFELMNKAYTKVSNPGPKKLVVTITIESNDELSLWGSAETIKSVMRVLEK